VVAVAVEDLILFQEVFQVMAEQAVQV